MKLRISTRAFARAAVVCALTFGAIIAACRDLNTPGPADDAWADQAVVSLQVQSEVSAFDSAGTARRFSGTLQTSIPVLRGSIGTHAALLDATGKAKRTVVKHIRDKSGKVISFGFHYAKPDEPPSHIYVFEDGRIRAIDSRTYRRHGNGWIRSRSRVTLFDDAGRPTLQVENSPAPATSSAPHSWSGVTRLAATAKDVVGIALPRALYAQQEGADCATEYAAWTTASGAVTVAAIKFAAAAYACGETGLGCVLAGELGIAVAAAVTAWSLAMDRYYACWERINLGKNDASVTRKPTGGGGGDELSSPEAADDDWGSTTDDVLDFIDHSIETGNYWCSSDGNHCVYYAAQ